MAKPTCFCGTCQKCKRREYMRAWYRRPGSAERVRGWAKRYREQNAEKVREADRKRGYRIYDMEKVRARKAASVLPEQPCEECGASPAQRHHDDYTRPLAVRWLCTTCHGIVHRTVA